VSFVGSALCIVSIHHPERARTPSESAHNVWREMTDGMRAVLRSPVLSTLAGWEALRNFFGMFIGALYVLYGLRELGLSPLLIGITVGVGGVSNLLGTLIVRRTTLRFGMARTMVAAALVGCIGPVVIALAPSQPVQGFAFLVAGQALDIIHPLFDVNSMTLRQMIAPPQLLGRVNATLYVIGQGMIPLGALTGGLLGDAIGLRPTLLIAAAGIVLGAAWLAVSPIASERISAGAS
jgi:predicted MFS family arabinose efflux permease